jgi:hypothetical protein
LASSPLIVKHHLAIVEVPEDAGVAVAFREILPVTVELLVGAVQATVGDSFAFAWLTKARVPPRARAAMTKAREILIGVTLRESLLFGLERLSFWSLLLTLLLSDFFNPRTDGINRQISLIGTALATVRECRHE